MKGRSSPMLASMLDDGETVLLVARPSLWMVPLWSLEAFVLIAGLVRANPSLPPPIFSSAET